MCRGLMKIWSGVIPDWYRCDNFGPTKEFELPDAKATDEEFEEWLQVYRHANDFFSMLMLDEASCVY